MNAQHYRSLLPRNDQRVYDRILESWKNKCETVVIEPPCSTHNRIETIVEYVAFDHPAMFHVDYYHFEQTISLFYTKLTFRFFHSREQIFKAERDIERWVEYVSSHLPIQARQQDKLWLIYDYIARQVSYQERGHGLSHTVLGCLPQYGHAAVCEGTSKGFKMLCDAVNLPCIIISGFVTNNGRTERHAWNMVEINGITRHIDVTAEIMRAHILGKAEQNRFLKRDVEMQCYQWERHIHPSCA